ncbi:nitrogen regulation protein NR(I) [Glaciecola sp. 1036]|uniref:nitrogen regulation protein NR(I) n=1 Tax=Alteromonadaceae TaxID=72275 RepID=UPI003D02CD37
MNEPVWIVDDDSSIRWVLEKAFKSADIGCLSFSNPEDLLLQIHSGNAPQVIISDVRMPQMDGMTLLDEIHQHFPDLPIIIMTAHSDLDSAVKAYKGGAYEYLPKPFDIDEAVSLTKRAIEHARETSQLKQQDTLTNSTEIIGEAPAMQEVFRAVGRLSRSSISVLINGQSGTGKELVAQALHKHSPRANKTFVPLNMAAIPTELIESELFGHEKGAFTGAQNSRQGRFEQADGGTLFLDEIGDMPIDVQTRLLRVLADGQFYRVGGHQPVKVDVRIIAATHQNLEQRVAEGKFREDLYHRLNVIKIHLPSLHERREDIPLLARHFLNKASKELGVESKQLSKAAADRLMEVAWPGNVRQLENTCRWLTVMASGQEILIDDLPPELNVSGVQVKQAAESDDWTILLSQWADKQLLAGKNDILDTAQYDFEKILLSRALKHTRGHKQEAAKRLGWGRNTLTRKLKELNFDDD